MKFNCEPKLSDFNNGEKINKNSVFERRVNSTFFIILISDNPDEKIWEAKFWCNATLSASDIGNIEIKKNNIQINEIKKSLPKNFNSIFLIKELRNFFFL